MIDDAVCWTVIQPVTGTLTPEAIAERLGGSAGDLEYEPDEGIDESDYEGALWISREGSSFVVYECNGYQGVRPEVLRHLSAHARTVSLFWNVNAHARLVYAVYGTVVTELDPLFPGERRGKDPQALDAELAALEQPEGHQWRAAAMGVVETITGVALDHPAPDACRLLLERTIPEDPRPPSTLGETDPDLDARLRLAPEPVRRAALHRVLSAYMAATGLDGDARVREALKLVASGPPDAASPAPSAWGEEVSPDHNAALRALYAAVTGRRSSYPFREAVDALVPAPRILGKAWPALRTELKTMLAT